MSGGISTFSSAPSVSGSLMSLGSLVYLFSMASTLASNLYKISNTSALAIGLLLLAPLPTRIAMSALCKNNSKTTALIPQMTTTNPSVAPKESLHYCNHGSVNIPFPIASFTSTWPLSFSMILFIKFVEFDKQTLLQPLNVNLCLRILY